MLAKRQWKPEPAPFQPARRRARSRVAGLVSSRGIPAEGVTEPMRGANESRRPGSVAEGLANLTDEIGQVRFDDECLGPETSVENIFGESLWPLGDERRQQLERLGRQVKLDTVPLELSGIEVEFEWAELNGQNRPPFENPAEFLKNP